MNRCRESIKYTKVVHLAQNTSCPPPERNSRKDWQAQFTNISHDKPFLAKSCAALVLRLPLFASPLLFSLVPLICSSASTSQSIFGWIDRCLALRTPVPFGSFQACDTNVRLLPHFEGLFDLLSHVRMWYENLTARRKYMEEVEVRRKATEISTWVCAFGTGLWLTSENISSFEK